MYVVLFGEFLDAVEVCWVTVQVDCDDGFGFFGDFFLRVFRVDGVGVFVDVCEHGSCSHVEDGLDCGECGV